VKTRTLVYVLAFGVLFAAAVVEYVTDLNSILPQ